MSEIQVNSWHALVQREAFGPEVSLEKPPGELRASAAEVAEGHSVAASCEGAVDWCTSLSRALDCFNHGPSWPSFGLSNKQKDLN